MPVVPTVDASKLRELSKKLGEIDVALKRQVGKDIKAALNPLKDGIMREIPRQAPSRGFEHGGRTAWKSTNIAVYATPGGGKGSIARLKIWSTPNNVAFTLADLAGTRGKYTGTRREHTRRTRDGVVKIRESKSYKSGLGRGLVEKLNEDAELSAGGKGGRYAWAAFLKHRPKLVREIERVIDEFAKLVEKELY